MSVARPSSIAALVAWLVACGPRIEDSAGSAEEGSADSPGDPSDATLPPLDVDVETLPMCMDQEVQGCTADAPDCFVHLVREVVLASDGACTETVEYEVCANRSQICEFIHVNYRHLATGRCFLFRSDCHPDPSLWGNDDECPRRENFPDCG